MNEEGTTMPRQPKVRDEAKLFLPLGEPLPHKVIALSSYTRLQKIAAMLAGACAAPASALFLYRMLKDIGTGINQLLIRYDVIQSYAPKVTTGASIAATALLASTLALPNDISMSYQHTPRLFTLLKDIARAYKQAWQAPMPKRLKKLFILSLKLLIDGATSVTAITFYSLLLNRASELEFKSSAIAATLAITGGYSEVPIYAAHNIFTHEEECTQHPPLRWTGKAIAAFVTGIITHFLLFFYAMLWGYFGSDAETLTEAMENAAGNSIELILLISCALILALKDALVETHHVQDEHIHPSIKAYLASALHTLNIPALTLGIIVTASLDLEYAIPLLLTGLLASGFDTYFSAPAHDYVNKFYKTIGYIIKRGCHPTWQQPNKGADPDLEAGNDYVPFLQMEE